MTGLERLCCLLGLMLISAHAPVTFALNCEPKPMELSYDHATHVFLARIVSSEILGDSEGVADVRTIRIRHRFEVIETFKGDVSYSEIETGVAWLSNNAHFSAGDVNLFFLDETRSFDSCSPKYLLEQDDTKIVLGKLRDLKKGVFETFSGAWATTVSDEHCSIYATYLLEGSSSTVSFSIGHAVATETKTARSNLWVYSYSKTGEGTIDRSGLTLYYAKTNVAIPYANSLLDNGSNFYTRLEQVDRFLGAVLSEKPVFLAASTRNNTEIEIPILLNGGSEAIREFARCGNLQVARED